MTTAVVLVSLGGPRSLEEVPSFVRRLVGRELPEPALQAAVERYRLIGGSSPLTAITEAQARALQEALGGGFSCRAAFRHTEPFLGDVLAQSAADAERICLLPLSPFYTSVTVGEFIGEARKVIAACGLAVAVDYLHSWYREPLFIEAWVEQIRSFGLEEGAFYLFSAHSLPRRLAEEPYARQIEETVELVAAGAGLADYSLGWQSIPAGAREPWLVPTVEERIAEAAAAGFGKLVQVPIGFTADHIETLYDIDICHSRFARQKGLSYRRVPSLNAAGPFIRALRRIVLKCGAHEGKD